MFFSLVPLRTELHHGPTRGFPGHWFRYPYPSLTQKVRIFSLFGSPTTSRVSLLFFHLPHVGCLSHFWLDPACCYCAAGVSRRISTFSLPTCFVVEWAFFTLIRPPFHLPTFVLASFYTASSSPHLALDAHGRCPLYFFVFCLSPPASAPRSPPPK